MNYPSEKSVLAITVKTRLYINVLEIGFHINSYKKAFDSYSVQLNALTEVLIY